MNQEIFKQATQKLGHVVMLNSPTILTGLSVAGLVGTVVMAVKATPKALRLLKDEEGARYLCGEEPRLTKKDIVVITWKEYLPSAILGTVTIVCIIGANAIHLRRNAALASLYTLTEAALKEYQAKVVETLGENKAQKIKDDIAKDMLEKNPVGNNQVIITGNGDMLCYDSISGRYFQSDIEKIRKLQNDLNRDLLTDMTISVNEVYDGLGLAHTKLGNELGWRLDDGMIEFKFSSQLSEEGAPCIVVDYEIEPLYSYNESH